MKKILANLTLAFALVMALSLPFSGQVLAQNPDSIENAANPDSAAMTTETATPEETTQTAEATTATEEEAPAEATGTQFIKQKFIEGGWDFMSAILICLILGMAIAIERIIVLNLSSTNTERLLEKVRDALQEGGIERAQQVAASTRGPIAEIFTQGLLSADKGVDMVEKTVMATGSVQMSKLEKGLVWLSLFISLAPMLGFMGTVLGMIDAFDKIEAAGDISPSLVAGGIKVALITTVGGLIVAVILQVLYNYCVAKIDSLVIDLEDASISLVDLIIKYKK
ncbi:MotA/TolQ/ExbB proton channel family protein [Hugenholtzia roseola]|uniref:MotA/TolQ/ExbB proton channel family protein n=1 Tax=Hugenholtzia roseola TaxID=1002 RepID=UPI0003F82529|nr:MotA/TolQ/ExbB proton channel family protein [Hugenholtzia roseola]